MTAVDRVASIRAYWDEKAKSAASPSATMKDVILRGLETEAIWKRLRTDDLVFEAGCGDGRGALEWAKVCRSIVSTDYSPGMVEAAARSTSATSNVEVRQADVLDLTAYRRRFTAAVAVRVLINQATARDQRRALNELVSVLCAGGRLFLVEGIRENFSRLNARRQRYGLAQIPLDWHNLLMSRRTLTGWLREAKCPVREVVDFGDYYFLSRVLHPLAVAPDEPSFTGPINRAAATVWAGGHSPWRDVSTLLLFVCEKQGG